MKKISLKEYVKRIILFYFKKDDRLPDIHVILHRIQQKKKEVTLVQLQLILNELVKEDFIYLYEGEYKLSFKNTFIPSSLSFYLPKALKNKNSKMLFSIQVVLILVGSGATYMSVHYTQLWFCSFLDAFRSYLLSIIMILFAVFAFELLIIFHQRKQRILTVICSTLWIIVTFFSMLSTVAGQYNIRMSALEEKYIQEETYQKAKTNQQNNIQQKAEYKSLLSSVQKEIELCQKTLSNFTTEESIQKNKGVYDSLFWRLESAKRQKINLLKEVSSLNEKAERGTMVSKKAMDFYTWLAFLFSFRPEVIQFWLSVFPALFIDIIAPFSFAIVFFLKTKK